MNKAGIQKMGIVTITNGPDNYGNVLQNYAIQYILKEMGYESETVNNLSFVEYRRNNLYLILKLLKSRKDAIKSIRFNKFKRKYIKYSKYAVTVQTSDFSKINSEYDVFICGSDQVWNPYYSCNQNWNVNLLEFTDKKKIGIAVSFGVQQIKEEYKNMFRNALQKFDYISAREISTMNIVTQLLGKKCSVVIDPTMGVSKEKWQEIGRCVRKLQDKKYVFLYVLGEESQNYEKSLKILCKRYSIDIMVDLMKREDKYYGVGPAEFLWLINNAEFILTDSFHATVFAILFNKPFNVFKRVGETEKTFGRIETLLEKFHLEDRVFSRGKELRIEPINEAVIRKVMKIERKNLLDFIEKAIKK